MEKNFLSSITKNKHIKEIITELNLNEDQILSAYPYFMNIIDDIGQTVFLRNNFQFSGFDFGEVKDVIDQ